MYRSNSKGVTVYQGQAWSLSGSDITITKEGTKGSPPKKRVIKGATQAVLKGLYEMGHKAIEKIEVAKKVVKKDEEE
jgi:hypothetical protein